MSFLDRKNETYKIGIKKISESLGLVIVTGYKNW